MTTPYKDVHTEHCCAKHGCKYGDEEECSVYSLGYKQSYPCESCDFEDEINPRVQLLKRIKEINEKCS